jgi:hypothetical protein
MPGNMRDAPWSVNRARLLLRLCALLAERRGVGAIGHFLAGRQIAARFWRSVGHVAGVPQPADFGNPPAVPGQSCPNCQAPDRPVCATF